MIVGTAGGVQQTGWPKAFVVPFLSAPLREDSYVRATKRETAQITNYVESQAHEPVIHAEKAASQLAGLVRHDIWDVHCENSRWWVITNPTNLYSQDDFKSRDVALTFHIGLTLRVSYLQEQQVPVQPEAADLLEGTWRRWQQAFETYEDGDEAEDFQAVGVRLRECLVSFIGEATTDDLVPDGQSAPQASNFKAWVELLANFLAAGESNKHLRSYLKKMSDETWEYLGWLTHYKNAIRMDAEIGLKAVEHLLGMFTAARLRLGREASRCEDCGSYRVVAGACEHCGWQDPSYEPPVQTKRRRRKPKGDCVPSSDISTFIRPEDMLGEPQSTEG
jgi:hypothetical protein